MKRGKLKTYVIRIRGAKTKFKARAFSQEGALAQVWCSIRRGYRYGVGSSADLKRKASVERID